MRYLRGARLRHRGPITLLLIVVAALVLLGTWNTHPGVTAFSTTQAQSSTPPTSSGTLGPASSSTVILYDNAIGQGFTDGTFGASTKNPCDSSVYYSAPCSYAIAYTAWGGLNFQVTNGSLNTSGFSSLQYKLNPNGQQISDYGALFISATGHPIKEIVLSKQAAASVSQGWVQVSIPLSQLNPSHAFVAAIQLKNELNKSQKLVHYDDVMITGGKSGPSPFATQAAPAAGSAPTAAPVATLPRAQPLPGQKKWKGGVSSFLFGANDTEEWSPDNVETDPHGIIQSSLKSAHFTLGRTFVFHYSLRDGHRTSIGNHPRIRLRRHKPHDYDRPAPPSALFTGSGYEVETRIKTIENAGMHCLVTFPDIWATPKHNVDPNPSHKRIIDPNTGKSETDLGFAEKVVGYLGSRCNLYEIGNEPDLDQYGPNGVVIHHMDVKTYVERWTEFVRALRKINRKAKFIGPVTYSDQGNDCSYASGTPYPSSQPGDCYMQNFLHGVKGTGVEPDAVSFHWYPCSGATPANCGPIQWTSYARVTNEVRGWVRKNLKHLVPVGITEWNFDPGANKVLGSNEQFMDRYTRAALASMISVKLDFASQFDVQSFSGYGALDMFDADHGDQPKAQFQAMKDVVSKYRPKPNPYPIVIANRHRKPG